jgi:hypothetical protein
MALNVKLGHVQRRTQSDKIRQRVRGPESSLLHFLVDVRELESTQVQVSSWAAGKNDRPSFAKSF